MVPYSLLDLSPILEGSDASVAFRNTLDLAQHAETWGYYRYWLAEHHNLPSVASADNCDSDTGESGRRKRNCRAKRRTASDKSLASRASASVTCQRVPTPLADPVQTTISGAYPGRAQSTRFVRDGRDDTRARR